jgi:hypothetical protein
VAKVLVSLKHGKKINEPLTFVLNLSSDQLEICFENTSLLANIKNDLVNIKLEYESIILPFISKYKEHFR